MRENLINLRNQMGFFFLFNFSGILKINNYMNIKENKDNSFTFNDQINDEKI